VPGEPYPDSSANFSVESLEATARKLRANIVRMIQMAGSGHNGGSLSAIDVITYLYFHRMRIDPAQPRRPDRDRFVMSKGHCCPALYVALAERGFFPEQWLWTLRDIDSKLQGHPDMNKTPGVDMSTGSLGQGISAAAGIAMGGKLDNAAYTVFCMVGDGELQEGQVWEAAMSAAHYGLDNLVVYVDNNKLETDGPTRQIMNVEPIAEKFRAFGWKAWDVNGHDFARIHDATTRCATRDGRPGVIVCDTVKGKGVSFMEGNAHWHAGPTSPQETEAALQELLGGAR
jgi:transketolase